MLRFHQSKSLFKTSASLLATSNSRSLSINIPKNRTLFVKNLPETATYNALKDTLAEVKYSKLEIEPGFSLQYLEKSSAEESLKAIQAPLVGQLGTLNLPTLHLSNVSEAIDESTILENFKTFKPLKVNITDSDRKIVARYRVQDSSKLDAQNYLPSSILSDSGFSFSSKLVGPTRIFVSNKSDLIDLNLTNDLLKTTNPTHTVPHYSDPDCPPVGVYAYYPSEQEALKAINNLHGKELNNSIFSARLVEGTISALKLPNSNLSKREIAKTIKPLSFNIDKHFDDIILTFTEQSKLEAAKVLLNRANIASEPHFVQDLVFNITHKDSQKLTDAFKTLTTSEAKYSGFQLYNGKSKNVDVIFSRLGQAKSASQAVATNQIKLTPAITGDENPFVTPAVGTSSSYVVSVKNVDVNASIKSIIESNKLNTSYFNSSRVATVQLNTKTHLNKTLMQINGLKMGENNLISEKYQQGIAHHLEGEYDVNGGIEKVAAKLDQINATDNLRSAPALRYQMIRNRFRRALTDAFMTTSVRTIVGNDALPDLIEKAEFYLARAKAEDFGNDEHSHAYNQLFKMFTRRQDVEFFAKDFDELTAIFGSTETKNHFNWSKFHIPDFPTAARMIENSKKGLFSKKTFLHATTDALGQGYLPGLGQKHEFFVTPETLGPNWPMQNEYTADGRIIFGGSKRLAILRNLLGKDKNLSEEDRNREIKAFIVDHFTPEVAQNLTGLFEESNQEYLTDSDIVVKDFIVAAINDPDINLHFYLPGKADKKLVLGDDMNLFSSFGQFVNYCKKTVDFSEDTLKKIKPFQGFNSNNPNAELKRQYKLLTRLNAARASVNQLLDDQYEGFENNHENVQISEDEVSKKNTNKLSKLSNHLYKNLSYSQRIERINNGSSAPIFDDSFLGINETLKSQFAKDVAANTPEIVDPFYTIDEINAMDIESMETREINTLEEYADFKSLNASEKELLDTDELDPNTTNDLYKELDNQIPLIKASKFIRANNLELDAEEEEEMLAGSSLDNFYDFDEDSVDDLSAQLEDEENFINDTSKLGVLANEIASEIVKQDGDNYKNVDLNNLPKQSSGPIVSGSSEKTEPKKLTVSEYNEINSFYKDVLTAPRNKDEEKGEEEKNSEVSVDDEFAENQIRPEDIDASIYEDEEDHVNPSEAYENDIFEDHPIIQEELIGDSYGLGFYTKNPEIIRKQLESDDEIVFTDEDIKFMNAYTQGVDEIKKLLRPVPHVTDDQIENPIFEDDVHTYLSRTPYSDTLGKEWKPTGALSRDARSILGLSKKTQLRGNMALNNAIVGAASDLVKLYPAHEELSAEQLKSYASGKVIDTPRTKKVNKKKVAADPDPNELTRKFLNAMFEDLKDDLDDPSINSTHKTVKLDGGKLSVTATREDSLPATMKLVDKEGRAWAGMILDVDGVQKTMAGGRVASQRVLVVVGNMSGTAGFGVGKGANSADALVAAFRQATSNVIHFDLFDNFGLAHSVKGKHNACTAYINATPKDRKTVASPFADAVLTSIGISSASCKLAGRRNPYSSVNAIFKALEKHESLEETSKMRGKRYLTTRDLKDMGL